MPARPKGLASVKHVFGWESRHDRELAGAIQPLADIGVVLSAATRDMDRSHQGPKGEAWYPYVREWAGWCQRLTGAYLQYAVITEGDLTPAGLRRYALVILPDTTCMSGAACRAVVDYVAGGGALIFTRDAGLYDETGRRDSRTERRLDALGAEIAAAARQRLASGNPTVRFGRHGRGKWAYFANRPGRIVFSEYNRLGAPRIRNVPEMTGVPGDTVRLHEALMMEAVRWAAGESRPLAVRQAPPGLLIKAFGRPAGRPRAVRIHLLNVRGLSAKAGDRIPARSPVTYPPQTEALVLDAAIRAVRQAYVISPDWPGRKPAGIRRLGGVCRVTIPKHTLKRYAVLCLDCGR